MTSVLPFESAVPPAFEPQKENNSAIANGVLCDRQEESFLKDRIDDDAKCDGKPDTAESPGELMDELQVDFSDRLPHEWTICMSHLGFSSSFTFNGHVARIIVPLVQVLLGDFQAIHACL